MTEEEYEVQPSYTALENIKQNCESLITSPNIEKKDALDILKLYHGMEKIIYDIQSSKDKEIESLKNELTIVKITNKNVEIFDSLTSDNKKLLKDFNKLNSDVMKLIEQHEMLNTSISRINEELLRIDRTTKKK